MTRKSMCGFAWEREDLVGLVFTCAILWILGLPEAGEEGEGVGAVEEDASEPLMGGSDNYDEDDQNYTIQAADPSSSPRPKAIGFFQACCLPGVMLVRDPST